MVGKWLQIAGGHKYLPPRQDVNAPDLYIPFMAACTYCVLASVALTAGKRFKPDTMYATVCCPAQAVQTRNTFVAKHGKVPATFRPVYQHTVSIDSSMYFVLPSVMRIAVGHQVSEASAAWLVHWVLLKGVLWVLGIPGAIPFLELAAYAGYAFVPVCVSMLAGLALGEFHSIREP